MQNQPPLSIQGLKYEEGLHPFLYRLLKLADASPFDLSEEGGWEALADQCEESGEPAEVARLALVTAWRVALQKLHGLLEWHPDLMRYVGQLKRAPSSRSVLRQVEQVREAVVTYWDGATTWSAVAPMLLRSALATLDRIRALHDRLKARGLLREN